MEFIGIFRTLKGHTKGGFVKLLLYYSVFYFLKIMKRLKKIESLDLENTSGREELEKSSPTIIYKVNISQFELTKLLYESEIFSRTELTASAKLFLWALCSHYNPNNKTMFPSQATVARKLGMSERSAERAAKELKEKGLVAYVTKRVNHYVFTATFFELVGLSQNKEKTELNLNNTVKMSERNRQNVGCEPRQNVGLTNKYEQINKKGSFNFFKGAKGFNGNQQNYFQPGGKAIPSIEETKELIKQHEKIREEGFNPMNYSRKEALKWLNSADSFWLKHSKIARHLIEKYALKEFEHIIGSEAERL